MHVQPYLFLDGRCAEALDFYRAALGARIDMLMRFKDAPEQPMGECAPGTGDKVMHASFRIGDSVVMASDGYAQGHPEFKGFSLSLGVTDDAEARRLFVALADGGETKAPLAATFFASSFGMLVDRFGVSWMVICPKPV